jgi:hypothetical protein
MTTRTRFPALVDAAVRDEPHCVNNGEPTGVNWLDALLCDPISSVMK